MQLMKGNYLFKLLTLQIKLIFNYKQIDKNTWYINSSKDFIQFKKIKELPSS